METSADGEQWRRIAADRRTAGGWTAVVVGLRPTTTYALRVGATVGAQERVGTPVEVTTGSAPSSLPDLVTLQDDAPGDAGLLSLGLISSTNWGALLDADGEIVWWYANPFDGRLTTRVVPSRDRRSVFLDAARSVDMESEDNFAILQVAWDGTLLQTLEPSFLHHDFIELPGGDLAWLSDDTREVDGQMVHGDTVVLRTPDGAERTLWSAWDNFDYATFAPKKDFVHANALQYDEATGVLWLSLRNANQLVQLDPVTGEELKRVFGTTTDYPLISGSKPDGQHGFKVWEGRILVHDNQDSTDFPSRIVEYAVTEEPSSVEQVWAYSAAEAYDVVGLGDAIRLPIGESLAIWGSSGVIDRVTPEGVLVARFAANLGTAFGYGAWFDDLQPLPMAE